MSPPPAKTTPAAAEKKEDEKKPEKKKSLGENLAMILLSILFIVIFLYILNPLLGMGFDASAQTIRTTGDGLQSNGVALIHAGIGAGVFMAGLTGFILKMLLIALVVVGSALLARLIVGLMKPKEAHH